ncbi:MAG TPA: PRC-barrel domain-containing protein [Steroidobacteraceae bacterium]|jgi:hypothetical protein
MSGLQQEHVMLHSIQKFDGVRVLAGDETVGTVEEAYFDDEHWVVRYLVVDAGGWLGGRRVLISPYAVHSIDWQNRALRVALSRDQVEGSPGIDTDKPVSRQQEAEYHRYYGYPQYWPSATFWAWGAIPVIAAPDPQLREEIEARRRAAAKRAGADAHLRSSRAVHGYRIDAVDELVGHVADLLFDERTWAIRYVVVEAGSWLHGRRVLVLPRWIRAVNWGERTLSVALTRAQIEHSPAYDPRHTPSPAYERALHRHYSRHQENPAGVDSSHRQRQ